MSSKNPPQGLKKDSSIRRMMSSFSAMSTRSLFGQNNTATTSTTTTVPLPHPRIDAPSPTAMTNPPNAQHAFQALQHDPATFMRRHQIKIRGQGRVDSGSADWRMVSEGTVGRRRNSVTQVIEPVYSYRIMSPQDYDTIAYSTEQKATHSTYDFRAQHVRMEQTDSGDLTTPTRANPTAATVHIGVPQNYITNALSGCSIKRSDTSLTHHRPAQSGTFSDGLALEDTLQQQDPNAGVFGLSRYRSNSGRNLPVNLFMQSDRDGTVHIHSQDRARIDANGMWTSNNDHMVIPAPNTPPVTPPSNTLTRQQRRTALQQMNAQTNTVSALDRAMAQREIYAHDSTANTPFTKNVSTSDPNDDWT